MTDVERYLAGVTVAALTLGVVVVAARVTRRRDDPCVASRALLVSDVAVVVLASAATTRNTLGLASSQVWLSIAWTVVAASAAARLMSLKRLSGTDDPDGSEGSDKPREAR